jgi:hypothetical protein
MLAVCPEPTPEEIEHATESDGNPTSSTAWQDEDGGLDETGEPFYNGCLMPVAQHAAVGPHGRR